MMLSQDLANQLNQYIYDNDIYSLDYIQEDIRNIFDDDVLRFLISIYEGMKANIFDEDIKKRIDIILGQLTYKYAQT